MANYECSSRTNYFRVTDEERYNELFENLVSNDEVYDFTKEENGAVLHGFGSYGSIDYFLGDSEDEDCSFDDFLCELQKILPDNEAFIYLEAGHEKLSYVTGYAIVCTNKNIKHINLDTYVIELAKSMLGTDFETEVDC